MVEDSPQDGPSGGRIGRARSAGESVATGRRAPRQRADHRHASRAPQRRAAGPASSRPVQARASPTAAEILALQQVAGNSAVVALVAEPGAFLQRCGSTPASQCPCHGCAGVQRTGPGGGAGWSLEGVAHAIQRARGNGRSLERPAQQHFERTFGTDLSDVRVHTGQESDELSRQEDAEAFTTGSDIFFRSGRYNPDAGEGRSLLAHELTHVIQQRGATPSVGRLTISQASDPAERQATQVAEKASRKPFKAPDVDEVPSVSRSTLFRSPSPGCGCSGCASCGPDKEAEAVAPVLMRTADPARGPPAVVTHPENPHSPRRVRPSVLAPFDPAPPVLTDRLVERTPLRIQRIPNPFKALKRLLERAFNWIKNMGAKAFSAAQNLGQRVVDGAKRAGTAAWNTVKRVGQTIWNTTKKVGQAYHNVVKQIGAKIFSAAKKLGTSIWNKAKSVGSKVWGTVSKIGSALWNTAKSIGTKIWTGIKTVGSKVGKAYASLAKRLWNKVKKAVTNALTKAKRVAMKAFNFAKKVAGKLSPSNLCKAIGVLVSKAFKAVSGKVKKAWAGAKKFGKKAWGVAVSVGTAIAAGVTKLFGKAKAFATKAVKGAFSLVKKGASKAWNTAKSLGTKAWNGAKKLATKLFGKAKAMGTAALNKAKSLGKALFNKAKALGSKILGKAKAVAGKLMGIANKLTGGLAGKIGGLAKSILGKASGILSRLLSKAKAFASKAISKAKSFAQKAMAGAKNLAQKAFASAKQFAQKAFAAAKNLGAKALAAAKSFAQKAWKAAKTLGAKAVAAAKSWAKKSWARAKALAAKAWSGIKKFGGKVWDTAKAIGSKLWKGAKVLGSKAKAFAKRIGLDKAWAFAKKWGNKALKLGKAAVEKLKEAFKKRTEMMKHMDMLRLISGGPPMWNFVLGCKAAKCVIPKLLEGDKTTKEVADFSTDVIPIVSTVKDACACVVGDNIVTGEEVGIGSRGISCAAAAFDIATLGSGSVAKGGVRLGGKAVVRGLGKGLLKVGPKELAEKGAREAAEIITEAVQKGIKALEKGGKEVGEKGAKGIGEELGHKGAKEAGGETAEKGVKEAGEAGWKGEVSVKGAGGHTVTATPGGRIMICTTCDDLRKRYEWLLKNRGDLDGKLRVIEDDLKAGRITPDEAANRAADLHKEIDAAAKALPWPAAKAPLPTPSGTVDVIPSSGPNAGKKVRYSFGDGRGKHTKLADYPADDVKRVLSEGPPNDPAHPLFGLADAMTAPAGAKAYGSQLTAEGAAQYADLVKDALENGTWMSGTAVRFTAPFEIGVDVTTGKMTRNYIMFYSTHHGGWHLFPAP